MKFLKSEFTGWALFICVVISAGWLTYERMLSTWSTPRMLVTTGQIMSKCWLPGLTCISFIVLFVWWLNHAINNDY